MKGMAGDLAKEAVRSGRVKSIKLKIKMSKRKLEKKMTK